MSPRGLDATKILCGTMIVLTGAALWGVFNNPEAAMVMVGVGGMVGGWGLQSSRGHALQREHDRNSSAPEKS